MAILKANNLVKTYGKRNVVNDVCIEANQGEIVGLLGPNGAGKTTTFYMITGMIRPNSGDIYLDDKKITNVAMYRRAQLGVGYLAQESSVFRKLTVENNLKLILEMMKLSKKEIQEETDRLLEEFKITKIRKSIAVTLSGGERRRTEIARILASKPNFILLDEPFAGIDPIAVEDIQMIIKDLKKKGIGVFITDHNVHETLSITDRSYLLFEGKILKEGTAEFLANDPDAKRLYLGEKFTLDRY